MMFNLRHSRFQPTPASQRFHSRTGLLALLLSTAAAFAQPMPLAPATSSAAPAPATPASAPATAPASAPGFQVTSITTLPAAKKPTTDQLMAGKTAPFDFDNTPIDKVIASLGTNFGAEVENNYITDDKGKTTATIIDLSTQPDGSSGHVPMVTCHIPGELSLRESLGIVNSLCLPLGYNVVDTVRLRENADRSPYVVLTIVATRKDAGVTYPVAFGMDPEKVPEGENLRTQIVTLQNLDIDKARELVTSLLGKKAEVTVNPGSKTLIMTDTGTHLHAAVALLQYMEKQAAPK